MSDDDDDEDISNKGNEVDMVTFTKINASSSSSSDGESKTAPTKVRVVSFNDEPMIFLFHSSDPDSDLDSTTDDDDDVTDKGNDRETNEQLPNSGDGNDVEEIKNNSERMPGWLKSGKSAEGKVADDNRMELEDSLDRCVTADNKNSIDGNLVNLSTDGPTTADVLVLQERWQRYETEKQNLDEMEERLQKRKTAVSEQETELEEYRAYLERRHKSLTKKEEDLCQLQDELEDLSDLLKEKREKAELDEEAIPDSTSCEHDEDKIDGMKHQLEESQLMEQELKQRLQAQEGKIQQKNEMITKLEMENEKLRSKMKRLETKLTADLTSTYGSIILDRQTSFTSIISTIPSDEKSSRLRNSPSTHNPDSSLQEISQHVFGSSDSSTISQRVSSVSSSLNMSSTSLNREEVEKKEGRDGQTTSNSNMPEHSLYRHPTGRNMSQEIDTCSDEDFEDDDEDVDDARVKGELVLEEVEETNEDFSEEVKTSSMRWSLLKKSSNITSRTCLLM